LLNCRSNIEEILHGLAAVESIPCKAAYYRKRGGAEVDLILTNPEGIRIPIEIKFGLATKRSDVNSLAAFIDQENCPYGLLINNSEEIRLLTPNILQIPAGCL
jgi:predicted AAA+ superfamily ATPase